MLVTIVLVILGEGINTKEGTFWVKYALKKVPLYYKWINLLNL